MENSQVIQRWCKEMKLCLFVAITALFLGGNTNYAMSASKKLKLAHYGAEGSATGRAMQRFSEHIGTAGEDISIELYSSGEFGRPSGIFGALRNGVVDLVMISNAALPRRERDHSAAGVSARNLSLAFLFGSPEVAYSYTSEDTALATLQWYSKFDFCPIGVALGGTRRLASTENLDSFQTTLARNNRLSSGSSAALSDTPGFTGAFGNAASRTPVRSDRIRALVEDRKVIDFHTADHQSMPFEKIQTISEPISYTFSILAINCGVLNSVGDAQRQTLWIAAEEAANYLGSETIKEEKEFQNLMNGMGKSVVPYAENNDGDDGCDDDECSSFGPFQVCDQSNIVSAINARAAQCCSDESSCDQ